MTGFDFQVASSKTPLPLVPRCGECQLYKGCISPKMRSYGEGKRKILVFAEAPGRTEDEQGRPLVGEAGQLLRQTLDKFGVDLDRDCWSTNALICRPPKNKITNPRMVDWCRPNIVKTLEELKPEVIIVLGNTAIKSLIGWLWRRDTGNMSRWDGWRVPDQTLNAWLCPTFHPSYILRTDYGVSNRENDVRKMFFERHLEAACKLKGRPWKKVPNYASQVRVIMNPDEAVESIETMGLLGNPVAWDLETSMLKPDHKNARIVCCSMSDGETTIAYPWHGRAIEATKEFLMSLCPKLGWNIAFEARFARAKLGVRVRNWAWDGMVSTHVIDNRPAICSLEFQAYVTLGQPPWDHGVSEYLEGESSNEPNRIDQMPIDRLMRYCAIDSLCEWKVCTKQMKRMGWSL